MASEMRMRDWSSDGCSSDRRAGGPKAEKGRQLESVRDQAQQRLVDHTASMQSSAPQLALLSRKQDLNAARVAANNTSFRFRSVLSRQRSEEHTSELQSLMRISYAVFCLKKKTERYILTYYSQQVILTLCIHIHNQSDHAL